MRLRSLLFVPGDRPERFAKAVASGADAVILDLEDAVAADRRPFAREAIAGFLGSQAGGVRRFVRVNPLGSSDVAADIAAAARADAIVLPKAEGPASVDALRGHDGAAHLPILPIASETPRAVFELGNYARVANGLVGLTWGAEDLPAAIGAATSREPDGRLTAPYEMVRALALFGAHAAGIRAIETVYPDIRDADGLQAYAERAARDGFSGMMAIHPNQIAVVNAAFSPTEAELETARRIVAAFAADPQAGAMQVDGRMVDAPHLKRARDVLARQGEGA